MKIEKTLHARKYPNRLGIVGWLGKGRHGFERYLYTLHRLTGVALLVFLIFHIFVTSSRLLGKAVWEPIMALTHHPVFQAVEFLIFVGFGFHALNGVRLLLVELGFAVGQPEEPVYPYKSSLNKQRPLMITMMVLAGLFILLGGFEFFTPGH
jgi:succinate dehydrogenase / fumarate reductase cytochrome b subunit